VSCQKDADCASLGSEYWCGAKRCRPIRFCLHDSYCSLGEACIDSRCTAAPSDSCADDRNCPKGMFCDETYESIPRCARPCPCD
jgi:hypothetical protein